MKSAPNPLRQALANLLIGILLIAPAIAQQPPEANGIAAKVNGRIITKNEVALLLVPERKRLDARFPDRGAEYEKQLQSAKDGILQTLIEREKTLAEANLAPIKIDPKTIDEEVQREIRDNYEGKQDQFDAALHSCRMTLDGYRKFAHDKLLAEAIRAREAGKK